MPRHTWPTIRHDWKGFVERYDRDALAGEEGEPLPVSGESTGEHLTFEALQRETSHPAARAEQGDTLVVDGQPAGALRIQDPPRVGVLDLPCLGEQDDVVQDLILDGEAPISPCLDLAVDAHSPCDELGLATALEGRPQLELVVDESGEGEL